MNLTHFSDLGLRALMHMSASGNGRTTAREVAEAIGAPQTHVAKVLSRLAEYGVVNSTRGRGGGISLVDDAESYSVGAILRFLEGPGEVIDCNHPRPCPFNNGCVLRVRLAEAQEAFFATLDPVTIGDIKPTSGSTLPQTPLGIPQPPH